MNVTEREKRHQRNLERINAVQLVIGRGDRAHVDHEGTLLERARLMVEELRSHEATEQGLAAFDRLLRLVEEGRSRQARWVAEFITAVWDDKPVRLSMLRGMPATIGDDVIAVLDGLRYARLDLAEHVAGGARRVVKVLEKCE
ncbi:DUF7673 family protein [Ramlibacter humi]|uniref:DUF7673 domain-containing protein n=1 Tax=Ramlibacter humi TaxID=2530451 RepID=A0A4Z0BWS4_9BURK|nr:hypothetical protein [Ramlibacter humi]TFZ03673.1 hypothetical protein EZ216_08400 [Ramlibacter humi]